MLSIARSAECPWVLNQSSMRSVLVLVEMSSSPWALLTQLVSLEIEEPGDGDQRQAEESNETDGPVIAQVFELIRGEEGEDCSDDL